MLWMTITSATSQKWEKREKKEVQDLDGHWTSSENVIKIGPPKILQA
jgi:hypothetical protein